MAEKQFAFRPVGATSLGRSRQNNSITNSSQASGREPMRVIRKAVLFVLGIVVAAVNFGCSARGVATSVPSRVFREVHGLRVRSYQIIPVVDDLRLYRRIEIRPLENLMLDQIPEPTVRQLNTEI